MVAVSALVIPQAPRAFRVLHGGRLVGFLGEGSGTFESYRGAAEPGPPGCRYRSVSPEAEVAILELLHASRDFDARIAVLERAGMRLEATDSINLFSPSWVIYRSVVPSSIEEEH